MPAPRRRPVSRWQLLVLLGAVTALISAFLTATTATAAPGGLSADRLTVDGKADPLNVTGQQSTLGWQLETHAAGVVQSAYRVAVATSPQLLAHDRPDVWDSGKVASPASVGVRYGGPDLDAGQRYYWKVRVWDGHGASSGWSRTATWDTALAGPADWKGAQWITPDRSAGRSWSDFTLDTDVTVDSGAAAVVFRAQDSSHYYMWQINEASTPGKVLLRPHVNKGGSFSLLG